VSGITSCIPFLLSLQGLGAEERRVLARLQRRARTHRNWTDYENCWMRQAAVFMTPGASHGRSRGRAPCTALLTTCAAVWGIPLGLVRACDYRAELEALIRRKYATRRAFCQATGLSENMLRVT
jgi:hypothetical protein